MEKNNVIKIYSPVNGEINLIENLKDDVFSKKMLGEGIYIKPTSNVFYSMFENGKISQIFHSKHAIFMQPNFKDAPSLLMHIGLDTVTLNGKGYELFVKEEEKVNLDSKIVKVDMDLIKDKGLSTETPIVLNAQEFKNWKLNILQKTGKVKAGQLIAEMHFIEQEVIKEKPVKLNLQSFFNKKNKYNSLAQSLENIVGTKSNYDEVYNCMTRLRFKIKNKESVDTSKINDLDMVKGFVWNGKELQVIIGQEVDKVKKEFSNLVDNSNGSKKDKEFNLQARKQEVNKFKQFLSMFGGIMSQIIIIFIGAGLIQALIGFLVMADVMPELSFADMDGPAGLKNAEWYWVILFAIGKTSGMFLGISVAVAAANYFKLNMVLGSVIGMVLSSPALFLDGAGGMGGEWVMINFGEVSTGDAELDFIVNMTLTKIRITFAGIKIFVIITSVFIAKKIDDWAVANITPTLKIMFRPFFVILGTGLIAYVILLPLWNVLEGILAVIMYYVGKLPLGIGIGIYASIVQVAVIFGLHLALGMVHIIQAMVSASTGDGGYAMFGPGGTISVYAQLGAMIGLLLVTKNAAERKQMLGLIPVGLVGITEPILYGFNLPRRRPLIAGIIAAFIAGSFIGATGVHGTISTGLGLFEIVGFFQYTLYDPTGLVAPLPNITNGILYIVAILISIGSAILISMLLCKERISEKTAISIQSRKLMRFLKVKYATQKLLGISMDEEELKKDIIKIKKLKHIFSIHEMKEIKHVEKTILAKIKLETKILTLNEKEEKLTNNYLEKGRLLLLKDKKEQAEKIRIKIESLNYEDLRNKLKDNLKEIEKTLTLDGINNLISTKNKEIKKVVFTIQSLEENEKEQILSNFWNATNIMLIQYKILNKEKEFNFSKEIKNLKLKNNDLKNKDKISLSTK